MWGFFYGGGCGKAPDWTQTAHHGFKINIHRSVIRTYQNMGIHLYCGWNINVFIMDSQVKQYSPPNNHHPSQLLPQCIRRSS